MAKIKNYVVKNLKNYEYYKASHNDNYEVILNVNENYKDFLNGELKEEFIQAIGEINFNRYPEPGNDTLIGIYSKYIGVKPENVLAGVGSDEGIRIISDTFLDTGDVAVTCVPTFSMYGEIANLAKARLVAVESDKEDFSPDIDKLIKTANEEKAKVIYICSPNNPTGYLYGEEEVKRIIDGTDSIVVIDEAYVDFAEKNLLALINYSNRVIVLRTLSKAFSGAALRVGFAIGDEEIIQYLNAARLPYNLSTLSMVAAEVLIKNYSLIEKEIHFIIQERERLIDVFNRYKDIFVFETNANFILIRSKKAKEFYEKAKEASIVLRKFENEKETLIRITVGSKEENDRLIKVIEEVF